MSDADVRAQASDASLQVEFTAQGYLHLSAELARRFFPNDLMAARLCEGELWLMPTRGPAAGGLLLKQRNPAGDRSVLIWEVLGGRVVRVAARWDDDLGAMRVVLDGGRE